MSEHQKTYLIMLSVPASLLIIGFTIAGALFGSRLFAWIGTFTFQLIGVAALGVLCGLLAGGQEILDARRFHFVTDSKDPLEVKESMEIRLGGIIAFAIMIGGCMLFYFVQYIASGMSPEIPAEVAYYSILVGMVMGIIFGSLFLGATIGRALNR